MARLVTICSSSSYGSNACMIIAKDKQRVGCKLEFCGLLSVYCVSCYLMLLLPTAMATSRCIMDVICGCVLFVAVATYDAEEFQSLAHINVGQRHCVPFSLLPLGPSGRGHIQKDRPQLMPGFFVVRLIHGS